MESVMAKPFQKRRKLGGQPWHCKDGVVMIPVEQFDQLMICSRRPKSLVQFFRESPLVGLELEFEKNKDAGRDIEL